MLLALRSLWEAVSETAQAVAESSGGIWKAALAFNLQAAQIRSAKVKLKRAKAKAKAGRVIATGGAAAQTTRPQDYGTSCAGNIQAVASGIGSPIILASARTEIHATPYIRPRAGAKAEVRGQRSDVRSSRISARGILNFTDDELITLLLAA